jgi:hypothetical protein
MQVNISIVIALCFICATVGFISCALTRNSTLSNYAEDNEFLRKEIQRKNRTIRFLKNTIETSNISKTKSKKDVGGNN